VLTNAASDGKAIGVKLAIAAAQMSTLVAEHEQAHRRWLLIQHVRVEDERGIAGSTFARQLAVDENVCLAAGDLAPGQRYAMAHPLLGVSDAVDGEGRGEPIKTAGSNSRIGNFGIDQARSAPGLLSSRELSG
jgi:hypothetical protein